MATISSLNSLPGSVIFIIFFCLGACLGSWLSAASFRIPRGIDVVHARSFCPHCGKQLSNRDNVPVLGYIILRGRSRCCGKSYGARYLLLEVSSGVVLGSLALVDVKPALGLAVMVIAIPAILGVVSHHSKNSRE